MRRTLEMEAGSGNRLAVDLAEPSLRSCWEAGAPSRKTEYRIPGTDVHCMGQYRRAPKELGNEQLNREQYGIANKLDIPESLEAIC